MFWILTLAGWELHCWNERRARRGDLYRTAKLAARALGRPLIVVGAPDCGTTAGYGSGDLVVDAAPSSAPNAIQADICDPLPFRSDSCVVFVSCVLEYVRDLSAALSELRRIAGRWLFIVRVDPYSLAAYLYPNARRTLPAEIAGALVR